MKKGQVNEFGYFLEGTSRYAIGEGESADTFRNVYMFVPYYETEVHEIITYEKGNQIIRALWKAQAAQKK